jgi:hypothetical protein
MKTSCVAFRCLCALTAFALYDPKPDAVLLAVSGEWKGALTYRDYSEPHHLVTLPTRLFVALSAPDELTLNYVFDDGPAKTVYSYDQMKFDFTNNVVTWTSGTTKKSASVYDITTNTMNGNVRNLAFDRKDGDKTDQFTMQLSGQYLMLAKNEVDTNGTARLETSLCSSVPANDFWGRAA